MPESYVGRDRAMAVGRATGADLVLLGKMHRQRTQNTFAARIFRAEDGGMIAGVQGSYRAADDGMGLMAEFAPVSGNGRHDPGPDGPRHWERSPAALQAQGFRPWS
ncbi:MAG: hypothetical protein FWD88_06065 [Treponema sp.]|nr:hypothetical protein [Treponema sp.]